MPWEDLDVESRLQGGTGGGGSAVGILARIAVTCNTLGGHQKRPPQSSVCFWIVGCRRRLSTLPHDSSMIDSAVDSTLAERFPYGEAMPKSKILLIDALINFVLGVLLVTFPRSVVDVLGVPSIDTAFYPSILGGVLVGIAVALIVEYRRKRPGPVGLGLAGCYSESRDCFLRIDGESRA